MSVFIVRHKLDEPFPFWTQADDESEQMFECLGHQMLTAVHGDDPRPAQKNILRGLLIEENARDAYDGAIVQDVEDLA